MKLALFIILSLPVVLSRPQAYSDEAFEISTNAAADVSHITAATIPPADQDGTWETLTTSHNHPETTGSAPPTTVPISEHPSAQSVATDASVSSSTPGGAVETLSQQTAQPISPTHIDNHGINELLAGVSNTLSSLSNSGSGADSSISSGGTNTGLDTSDSATESRDIAQDINSVVESTENEFLASSQQTVEPGFVPVYSAGGHFVAEVTIGSSYLLIKVDTSSFHFWVISNLLPDVCREATKAGSGCYKSDPEATVIPGNVGYTFRYRDGTQASGTQIYSDTVSAAGIFGAAAWSKQVFALPSQLQHWDGSSGISGILPLGFNAKEYWTSKASSSTSTTSPTSNNSTEKILDESPLDITNWHFFTTYFKPGSQMFVGFDYDPKDLYEGNLVEVPVAAINGSWFVMPDSTWATVAVGSGSASATAAATDAGSTPAATATDTGSGSGAGSSARDSGSVSASPTDTETNSPAATATDSVNSTSITTTDAGDAGSATATDSGSTAATTTDQESTITETASSMETSTVESLSVENAANTQLVATAGTDSIKKRSLQKRQDSASMQYPILLDTGSKETLIDTATVKSIYNSLQGSCLTVNGGLHNCTFPCSFNYSNFAITPEYPASIGLPWGQTTIPVDLSQFASEVYDGCHPESGADSCSSTCRGMIQAQKQGKEYYIYGTLVFKSAFFKWDTSGNGTIGMAPYAGRAGGSWYYQ
ncbi:hypothetical protein TWF225_001540 [Orbilia oligospora]|nr:hypothetical protein TWF225_001540 [Orbilia oligospora]KAF3267874.1 hypothetical protein TWF217_011600 [Orbilia oligospora]KAF3269601.1 hypothetical protein TWF128_005798 [Orbilia oligospora]